MVMLRHGILHKFISIAAVAVVALYVSYSIAAVSADVCLCQGMFCSYQYVENEHCCAEEESAPDCCFNEIPVQDEPFHPPYDMSAYRNNISDVQTYVCDGLILVEISSVDCEEQFIPQYVSYFIFRPPKA